MRKRVLAGIALALVIVLAILLSPAVSHRIVAHLHRAIIARTEQVLQTHFDSQIQFADFEVSVYPRVHVKIDGLVMKHQGRTDIPPLIQVRRVSMETNLRSLMGRKPTISLVTLEGLQIYVPPRQHGGQAVLQKTDRDLAAKYPVLIDELRADDGLIAILRDPVDKPPRSFPIHHLIVHDLSFDRPARFHAMLTNAVPTGEIDATGEFGPWLPENPRESVVRGQFTFDNANLGTLKGIQGTLSSKGTFDGPLDYMKVDGVTDTPDFGLRTADHPLALHTEFSAIVDGTNGDTYLNRVTAHFLRTTLAVSGQIVDLNRDVKSRTILLNASSNDARVEDLIALTTKGTEPVMTGLVKLKAKIDIPEANTDLIDRLKLSGEFDIDDARFTKASAQTKVDTLSRKGQGKPKDMEIREVDSEMTGRFEVAKGVVKFSDLTFGVPGADIQLAGTYNLDGDALNFHGKLKLQAKPSQTTTGMKSFLLKAVDPFFKGKDAGTVLAIRVGGTKSNPTFGRDRKGGASD